MLQGSSGIKEIETDTFKLHCHQTLTGVKFVVVADRTQVGNIMKTLLFIILFQAGVDQLLDKIYELYADFALKNPFYSLEMPIRYGIYTMDDFEFSNIICRLPRADLFDEQLQVAIDQIERTGFI